MLARRLGLLLLLALSSACRSGTDGNGGGDDDDDGGSPVDYDAGTWVSEVIVDTPGTISHDIAGVFTGDGTFRGTWMEPDVDATSGEDIWEVARAPGGSWTTLRLTNDGSAQAAYNTMATDGTTVHLAYNSAPDPDNDVFYARHTGSAWSARIDVTTPDETGGARHDFQTDIAVRPGGGAVIAYVSASVAGNGGIELDGEIRIARIAASGSIDGSPTLAIPAQGAHGCFDPSVVVDESGTIHVAADCGNIGAEEIWYTNDAAGTFAAPVAFAGGSGRDDVGVHLALDPDGTTVHAVWLSDDGDRECRYSRRTSTWSAAISASSGPADDDGACSLGVDALGRVLVAFHRQNGSGNEDVFLAWSADGSSFGAPRIVTPDTDDGVEWFPDVIAFEPETGVPHVFYETLLLGSSPLNTRILHAVLEP